MEPVTVVAAGAAAVFAKRVLEEAGTQTGKGLSAAAGRLVDWVRQLGSEDDEARAAASSIQADPTDQSHVEVLARILSRRAAADSRVERELRDLVDAARQAGDVRLSIGGAHIHGSVMGGQVTQVGELIVQLPPGPLPRGGLRAVVSGQWLVWPSRGGRISNLRARNPLFVGRQDLLASLAGELKRRSVATLLPSHALHGLGGVGKTELAVEFAWRQRDAFDVVWWVDAEQPVAIPEQLSQLAHLLGLPQDRDLDATVAELLGVLAGRDRWLLIFDNAPGPNELMYWWPDTSAGGQVLVTSRNPAWLAKAHPVPVDVLPRADAVEFLQRRTESRDPAAASLADALGDLPLALEQAGAYIEQTMISPGEYLQRFRQHAGNYLGRGQPVTYPHSVATTFALAITEANNSNASAGDLLRLFAFLAPDDIPRDLVPDYQAAHQGALLVQLLAEVRGAETPPSRSGILPGHLLQLARNRDDYNDALAALRRYSLITVASNSLGVHRLVQAVTRDTLTPEQSHDWASAAVLLVRPAVPEHGDDVMAWTTSARLLPHILAATEHARALEVEPDVTVQLLTSAAGYLWSRAETRQAKELLEAVLDIRRRQFGDDHLAVAGSLTNVGIVLRELGEFDTAQDYLQRALRLHEAHGGPDDLNTAHNLAELGTLLRRLGRLEAAREHTERALNIRRRRLGDEDPSTAQSLANLANILQDLGELDGARDRLQRALAVFEAQGEDRPDTAHCLTDLGVVMYRLGDFEASAKHHKRALEIYERRVGEDHPDTRRSRNNLSSSLAALEHQASVVRRSGDLDADDHDRKANRRWMRRLRRSKS